MKMRRPYYGWVIGYTYNGTTLAQGPVLNVSPNTGYSGIWMSGSAPAADGLGNLYLLTGNGTFNATNTSAPNNDYGDSLLKLDNRNASLTVAQYFTPSDQLADQQNDQGLRRRRRCDSRGPARRQPYQSSDRGRRQGWLPVCAEP
jgi:hypothetical protein